MMSGMRKPSPISISSPRETIDFAAGGQFVQRQKDGGGVVVDDDAGRAEQPFEQRAGVHIALAAACRWRDRIPDWSSPGRGASGPSGARPRLVCRTTPVALMTRRSEGSLERGERVGRRCSIDSGVDVAAAAESRRALHRARGGPRRPPERARKARGGGRQALDHLVHGGQVAQLLGVVHEFDGTATAALVQEGAADGYTRRCSGRGSAWLERLVRDQEVGGSNPLAPTILIPLEFT